MIRALATGTLHDAPQQRTSQTGKPYTTAKLRADGKDGNSAWCSLIAFGEAGERLATLPAGAALAVAGRCEVNAWLDKQGEPKASLSLVVDELATLKGKPRPPQGTGDAPNVRQGQGSYPRQQRPTRQPVAAGAAFNDALPDCFS